MLDLVPASTTGTRSSGPGSVPDPIRGYGTGRA